MKKIIYFFVVFFLIYGLVEVSKKIFPFLLNDLFKINSAKKYTYNTEKALLKKCKIQKIDYIPDDSIAVIGHAYGSWEKSDDKSFISEKVEVFLNNNSNFLSKVIFTGDVFKVPSIAKWKKLNNTYNNKVEIYIAPGNHDFYKPISRIYFFLSPFGSSKFPVILNFKNKHIVVEDSITNQWQVNNQTVELINSLKKNNIIITRHNVPITELIDYSNSLEGMSNELKSYNFLKNKIPFKKVTWLIGDGMSLNCFEKDNHRFIVNGVSDLKKDTILIINKTEVYHYSID